jgi:mRNA interferase MazF
MITNLKDYGSNVLKVKQRDIVLIKFPFSDLTGAKVRPAVVISNNTYNQNNLDAVVLAITSNLDYHPYKILLETQDLKSGNLPIKSSIRIDKPFSILQANVLKIQAKISSEKLEEVKLQMQNLIK